jgi:RHS repeat-associated protein
MRLNNDIIKNTADGPLYITLEQQEANGEWQTVSSTNISTTGNAPLSGKPSNYSALRLKFSGASFTLNKYTYQRVDEFTTSAVVLLCSSDEDFEGDYRFGFNGMHKDDEVKGSGNSLDFGARVYDSRLGRWLSLDPLQKKYPDESAFIFAGNSPLMMVDIGGNFKMTDADIAEFPMTALLLQNAYNLYHNIPLPAEVQNQFKDVDFQKIFNDNFRAAFEQWSTMNAGQVDEMLTWNSGPMLTPNYLKCVGANGYTPPPTDSKGTELNAYNDDKQKVVCVDFEVIKMMEFQLTGKRTLPASGDIEPTKKWKHKTTDKFLKVLFHEGCHYGRYVTGKGNRNSDLRKEGLVGADNKVLEIGNQFEKQANADGKDTPDINIEDMKK